MAHHLTDFEGEDGSGTETALPENANSHYWPASAFQRPVRVGIFARDATTREQAGAGYSGNMELSANLWERIVMLPATPPWYFKQSFPSSTRPLQGQNEQFCVRF